MALHASVGSSRNMQDRWTGILGLPFLMLFMYLIRALFLVMLLMLFLVSFLTLLLFLGMFLGMFLMLLPVHLFLLLLSIRLL